MWRKRTVPPFAASRFPPQISSHVIFATIQLELTMPQHLFTPGPTPLHPAVAKRLHDEPVYHRGAQATELFSSVHSGLQQVFSTHRPVFVLTCSGTGAVEAAMLNTLDSSDSVIVFNNGRFAQRWVDMLYALGIPCVDVRIPWGTPVQPDIVAHVLEKHPGCTAVWMVHSETSTGVTSDVESIAATIREHSNALVCIDAISSLGVHELRMDAWGLDVVVSSSQKGLMSPSGLAALSLSSRAWQRVESLRNKPTLYFNLEAALKAHQQNRTPWTPAMILVMALDTSLQLLLHEGIENVWKRHAELATRLRTSLVEAGYTLYSHSPSNAVTAVYIPKNIPDIVQRLEQDFAITVAKGQDVIADTIFRIGHIGPYTISDIDHVADACGAIIKSHYKGPQSS